MNAECGQRDREAIKIYNITDTEHQKRLAVRWIKYLGSPGSGEAVNRRRRA
jgi:hypothetical protein